VAERFLERFAAGDWDAIAEILADDFFSEDRRPVVGVGIRHGRDVEIASIRAGADLGGTNMTSPVIATRGARLILTRTHHSGRDQVPEAFRIDVLAIVEIDADNRIAARIVFDPDDIDAAFEELDARYIAGEAADHAHAWSVIARTYAEFNRHDYDPSSVENIDHRRVARFAPGDLRAYVEAVHRLSDLGAVVTSTSHGTSQEGFEAEWRVVLLQTVDGDLMNRNEMFDEADLDAALARFGQLSRPAPRLENAASKLTQRFWSRYEARDWDAMGQTLADDVAIIDRRPLVSFGVRQGPDSVIEIMRAAPDMGVPHVTQTVIATRGERLVLIHARFSARDQRSEAFYTELFYVIEINVDSQIAAFVLFDTDDIDAAFAALDARYLAGDAAAHSQTWSVIVKAYAAFNRHEFPAATPDWVTIDHRRGASFEPGGLTAYIRSAWDDAPDSTVYLETVHRVSALGAVVTQTSKGSTQHGFEAEWRQVNLMTVDGDLLNRCELFDEADLDAALARFDELIRPARGLENTASRTFDRFNTYLAARDWDAMAEMIADDVCHDDRRRVVSSGIQLGRDAQIANLRAVVDVGVKNIESFVIAIRGERLALTRTRVSGGDQRPEAFGLELLNIVELGANNRITAAVQFDLDDVDSAFEELDARYLLGEAATHSHTWSVIADTYAAFNRRELDTTSWVNVDHRRVTRFAPGELTAAIGAAKDLTPDLRIHIEAVHRLSNCGAVVTNTSYGTSKQGFDAEWRMVQLLTVEGEGDRISRLEIFDEDDIDAALAKFDELHRPTPRLENAVTNVAQRFWMYFAARDWDAMAGILADGYYSDDRRRVVGAGVRQGRDGAIPNMRTIADLGFTNAVTTAIATRGRRLGLVRSVYSGRGQETGTVLTGVLAVAEVNADDRITAIIVFDSDDIDAAFEELEARYVAGEAVEHSHTWSLIARTSAAFNRHVMPPTTPDWVNIDHRKVTAFAPGDMTPYMRATLDVAPDIKIYIEAVHRLSNLGAVFTQPARGISHAGFEAEWRDIILMSIERDQFNRCELFDETDLDAALARFDELSAPTT
jgi:hypothetical protein